MAYSGLASDFVAACADNYTYGRSMAISRITVHHMAGVMSAVQCGRIFQTPRGASAHYGIGVDGDIAAFVDESNTAWSDGNWDSNCRTVSIETSNSATGGDWPVSEASWGSLIRLTRDIAERNGLLPLKVGVNLFGHRDVCATACPGDYLYSRLQALADAVNGGGNDAPAPSAPNPGGLDLNAVADAVIRGDYGNGEDRYARLRAAGYDPDAVQAIVNAKLGYHSQPTQGMSDLGAVADAVIRGDYGNGSDREANLRNAGYDYNAVQELVNQKLGYGGATPTSSNDGAVGVGDRVVVTNWVDYNGTPLVKTRSSYFVSELNGDRAVLNADAISGAVYAAVNVANLRKA